MAIKTPKETIVNENQIRYASAGTKSQPTEGSIIDNSKIKPSNLVKVEIERLLQEIILHSSKNEVKLAAQKCIKLLSNI